MAPTVTGVDFSGPGVGKALLPIVVRQAQKEAPQSCQKLKQRLEQAASPSAGQFEE